MSKVILSLCLLTAVILVACIDTGEFDSDNMTTVGASRGLRIKRDLFCWDDMVAHCCTKKNYCKGAGCRSLMCSICC
uniref:Uncharacterized protein n=1 Tax=Acrobeloides nanus TaxID=290746 RepID=A0A914CV72_9BILA